LTGNWSRPEQYWSQPPATLLALLHSTPDGLSAEEAGRRLSQVGPNVLEAKKKATALGVFINQFKSPIILILIFATALSAVLKDWVDAVIILAIVLGSALLSFLQEYRASTAAEKLRAQVTVKATVLRDGQTRQAPAEELVPGDVVHLSAGSLVPADSVLLEVHDLFVNQAVLTGETFPVEKCPDTVAPGASLAQRTTCVFVGTSVSSGSARALIVQTGAATAFGQIAKKLALRPPETEFERGVRRLGYLLSEVVFLLVLAVLAMAAIVLAYVACTELVKHWFYRRYGT
jgi:Mg2+-importing ATPase